MQSIEATLKESKSSGPGTALVTFSTTSLKKAPVSGQFFMVKLLAPGFPLFGRAFAVLDYNPGTDQDEISFLAKEVGSGTSMLLAARPGDRALLVGPAGNRFPPLDPETSYIFVAGGTGIAAFRYMMHALEGDVSQSEKRPLLLYGARDKASLFLHDELETLPLRMKVSTEDGSIGTQGLVTALLTEELNSLTSTAGTVVYACGPDLMMKAVAGLCAEKNVALYLSLECRMACGIGVCNGCAVEVVRNGRKSFERACFEGPVFRADTLPFYTGSASEQRE